MSGRLENKVCYITGAASGIGLACAERLSAESATVIGSDLQSSDEWNTQVGGQDRFYELDVRDE